MAAAGGHIYMGCNHANCECVLWLAGDFGLEGCVFQVLAILFGRALRISGSCDE